MCWGCGSIYINQRAMMEIYIGMPKEEVLDIFGNPKFRAQRDNQREQWKYQYQAVYGYDYLEFVFHNDTVESYDSYFKSINEGLSVVESTSSN